MIAKKSAVLYKKQPAVVQEIEGDKFLIQFRTAPASASGKPAQYAVQKVREKDIAALSDAPVSSLDALFAASADGLAESVAEAHELLLSDEEASRVPVSFAELSELVRGGAAPEDCWLLFKAFSESLEFALDEAALKNGAVQFLPHTMEEIGALKKKLYEKEHEAEIHAEFMERLKGRKLALPDDAKFMAEVEGVAFGRIEKSRIMAELKTAATPENAHRLLLDCGIWEQTRNPYPARFGLSMASASEGLGAPPEEERLVLEQTAYAIDNAWSADPDDAVGWDGTYLWVHIADPASFVLPDSSIDKAARARGATLYIPEGAARMLAETSLADYALGLAEPSRALSFRLLLNEDCTVSECRIFKTVVNVKRLTYEQADGMKESAELAPLFGIAAGNAARRKKSGATQIDLPEVHIHVDPETKKVDVSPLRRFEADAMVCEMMLLAGEGAAHFAFQNGIPFPYVSQEAPEIPAGIAEGLAGQFRLLRGMRRRSVGIAPAMHFGLGIAMYSQVTSPLRRYGDLVAHEQLRAYLDGRPLIDKNAMLERISAGDAASVAARKASRLSDTHWKLIYLLQNPGWTGEAVCVERRGAESVLMIPSLAMQTSLKDGIPMELNESAVVRAADIDIPTQAVNFVRV
ncbi:MAG: RNB domain-containing ribonuclease [Treponemataceae bacterium]|nr:RNB domain-containing ribonuclease [Treponemataceae bacterium]